MKSHRQRINKKSESAKKKCFLNGDPFISKYHGSQKNNLMERLENIENIDTNTMSVNFNEARMVCLEQERLILREINHPRLENDFYQFCKEELKGLSICSQIERIGKMSNQEALLQFHTIWQNKPREIIQEDQSRSSYYEQSEISIPDAPLKFSIFGEPQPEFHQISHKQFSDDQEHHQMSFRHESLMDEQFHNLQHFNENDLFEF